jgi:hypothetical protein
MAAQPLTTTSQALTPQEQTPITQHVVQMSNFGNWFKHNCKHTMPKQTKKGALIANVTFKNGPDDVTFNPAVQYGSFLNESERAHLPFGIAQPFELKEGANYNVDINLFKTSPEWLSMYEFDKACVAEGYANRTEWFGDATLTEKDIERKWYWGTKNLPPNDPVKRKNFDPNEYPPKLRTKYNAEQPNCYELLEYTSATATSPADIRVKRISHTDIGPNSYVVCRMVYRGMWFAQGNFGPMFQQVSIVKTVGGGLGVSSNQFTEGTMTIATEPLSKPAAPVATTTTHPTDLDLGEDAAVAVWASQVEQEHSAMTQSTPEASTSTKKHAMEEGVEGSTMAKKKGKKSLSALEFA